MNKRIATRSELEHPTIKDRTVFIGDIPLPLLDLVIRQKRFENCNIIGPAVISVFSFADGSPGTTFTRNTWHDSLERVAWPSHVGQADKAGITYLSDVAFISCHLYKVSIIGTENIKKLLKPKLPQPTDE